MTLRIRNMLILTLLIFSMIISFYLISETIFLNKTLESEDQNANMVMNNTLCFLNNNLINLNNTAKDWSQYDEGYYFVKYKKNDFIERNLSLKTFSRLKINLIIFINNNGKIICAKRVNWKTGKFLSMPNDLKYFDLISKNNDKSGYIILNGSPMMLVSKPILRSDGKGPQEGTLIMGRDIDTYELKNISNCKNIFITTFNNSKKLNSSPPDKSHPFVIIKSKNKDDLNIYSSLRGISGSQVLMMKMELPRLEFKNYKKTIFLLTLSLIIIGVISIFLVYYLLDRKLMQRIEKICCSIQEINQSKDLSERIPLLGSDELTDFAESINFTLKSIQNSQEELIKNRDIYKTLFENTGTAMVIVNTNWEIKLYNNEFNKKFELYNQNFWNLLDKKDLEKIEEISNNNHKQVVSYELRLITKEKGIRYFFTSFSFFETMNEILISIIDINELKTADMQIETSLKEKELLLREIHHRVKNNLQVISALLRMQAREFNDPNLLKKYKETDNRILTISLIHERLYRSKNLSKIDIKSYIQSLVTDLRYSSTFSSKNLNLILDINDCDLNIETAMPIGLIINELVSNCLQHAFSNISSPEIKISLKKINNDKLELKVCDNGIGLPSDFDLENINSLGLKLVQELVIQIDGEINFKINNGVCFSIIFSEIYNPATHS